MFPKAKMTNEEKEIRPKTNNFKFWTCSQRPKCRIEKNETHPKINNLNFGHVQGPKKI